MTVNPYVVGQWVRGEKFYGRNALIESILHGNRNCLWVLGTRRIGKTSLLKQLELISVEDTGYFPVFWDFQGAETPADLHEGFGDSLLDAEERLEQCIVFDQVEDDDLFASLNKLRRKLKRNKLKLLLLCDEVEELVGLNEKDPYLLKKLRRAMQSHDDIRSVLASKIKLWELSQEQAATSPFLEGFTPPLYIQPLEDDEARALIRQVNLPSDSRPRLDEHAVEFVRGHCNNHPYLIQLLCERYMGFEDLQRSIEELAADPMISYFFSVDYELLSETEQSILDLVARRGTFSPDGLQQELAASSAALDGAVHRLEHLGYVRRGAGERYELANFFFARWFREVAQRRSASGATPAGAESQAPPVNLIDPPSQAPSRNSGVTRIEETEQSVDDLPRVINERYELVERIGHGATGAVYKAYDRTLRVHIAVKLLKPDYATNEESLERLRREIVLSRDMSHPNILRLYHLGEFEGKKFLTMQWMRGPTLARVIAREAPLEAKRVLPMARALASALEAAHGHHVLHRDIKPSNILIDDDGEPKITDFGLARLVGDPGLTGAGIFVGTPDYSSPEQANLRPLDARSDLYSLGVVLYEMLIGKKPFYGGSITDVLEQHRSAVPPPMEDVRPGTPPELCGIVLRLLEKNPEDRFASAAELCAALNAVGAG